MRELFGITDHAIYLGHCRKPSGVDLRRAARHDDLRTGAIAPGLADPVARFAHRIVGHRAAVDHDDIAPGHERADRFAFRYVQAAAETDDVGIGADDSRRGGHER